MQEDHLSPGKLVLLHSHPVWPFGASHHEQLVYIATMKLNCGRLSNCNEVISRWQHEEGIKNLVSCSGLRLQGDRSWCCTGYITARLAEVTVITLRPDLFLGTWFYTVAANTTKALGAGGSSIQQLSPRHYFIPQSPQFPLKFLPSASVTAFGLDCHTHGHVRVKRKEINDRSTATWIYYTFLGRYPRQAYACKPTSHHDVYTSFTCRNLIFVHKHNLSPGSLGVCQVQQAGRVLDLHHADVFWKVLAFILLTAEYYCHYPSAISPHALLSLGCSQVLWYLRAFEFPSL